MKTKTLTLFLTLLVYSNFCYSQITALDDSLVQCGTVERTELEMTELPWYGNNDFLIQFNETIDDLLNDDIDNSELPGTENFNSCNSMEGYLTIPIKFWIYRESETEPGLPNEVRIC